MKELISIKKQKISITNKQRPVQSIVVYFMHPAS